MTHFYTVYPHALSTRLYLSPDMVLMQLDTFSRTFFTVNWGDGQLSFWSKDILGGVLEHREGLYCSERT